MSHTTHEVKLGSIIQMEPPSINHQHVTSSRKLAGAVCVFGSGRGCVAEMYGYAVLMGSRGEGPGNQLARENTTRNHYPKK